MALTDTEICRSKPSQSSNKLCDGGGLHFAHHLSGRQALRWKYRFDGAEKLMALGRSPETIVGEARERRDAARKRHSNGADPMAERMAEKTAIKIATEHTFEKIAELWLERVFQIEPRPADSRRASLVFSRVWTDNEECTSRICRCESVANSLGCKATPPAALWAADAAVCA